MCTSNLYKFRRKFFYVWFLIEKNVLWAVFSGDGNRKLKFFIKAIIIIGGSNQKECLLFSLSAVSAVIWQTLKAQRKFFVLLNLLFERDDVVHSKNFN